MVKCFDCGSVSGFVEYSKNYKCYLCDDCYVKRDDWFNYECEKEQEHIYEVEE